MRATTLIATLALTGGIIGAGAMFVPAFAQNAATTTTTTTPANWMTMEQVQTRLESTGYRDFEKIERDSNKYEVKATDAQGRRVELDVDPVTGDILKTEVKRSK
jgi:Peptidase propeptide and YPEB domain.